MRRNVYGRLLEWKNSENRKPLILRGMRQCGKTYILKKFGEENYKNVQYFNFEGNEVLSKIFDGNLDPEELLKKLRAFTEGTIDEDTLIIFDEIQFCGKAITSLKYFCEDAPGYHVVCAGSLLGVLYSNPTSFPVGKVSFIEMYPMSFDEFLLAMKKENLYDHICGLKRGESISESVLELLNISYREYCFTGGMPEAIKTWRAERDPRMVREIQNSILTANEYDFVKYAPKKDIEKIRLVWSRLTDQLTKENRKFIFGHVVEGARGRDLEDAVKWLIDAGLVYKVCLVKKVEFPLTAFVDHMHFKLYFSDIGLFGAMAKLPPTVMTNDSYLGIFKGSLTENYVLTELIVSMGEIPYYWRSNNEAEIDFLLMLDDMIIPIEVKTGSYKRLKSMERYMELYDPKRSVVVSKENLNYENMISVPLPLVWRMKDMI